MHHIMPDTVFIQYAYTQYPTHSIQHTVSYTVCLTSCLTVCLKECLQSMTQHAYTQYPTHRPSFISNFQNLKSQNIILKYFMTSLLKFFLVCLHTVRLCSMTQSMLYSMPIKYASVCLHTLSYIQYPTQYTSQYASQYAYAVCLTNSYTQNLTHR